MTFLRNHRDAIAAMDFFGPLRSFVESLQRLDPCVDAVRSGRTDELRVLRDGRVEAPPRPTEKLTAILGDDLRDPLDTIATAAQLVQRQAAGAERAAPLPGIVDAAEQVSRLIAQLLELARCNAPDTNSPPRP